MTIVTEVSRRFYFAFVPNLLLPLYFRGQALCQLDVISSVKLFYSWPLICKGEVWRLFTNFFYFGSLNLDFLFHMYFLVSVGACTVRHAEIGAKCPPLQRCADTIEVCPLCLTFRCHVETLALGAAMTDVPWGQDEADFTAVPIRRYFLVGASQR